MELIKEYLIAKFTKDDEAITGYSEKYEIRIDDIKATGNDNYEVSFKAITKSMSEFGGVDVSAGKCIVSVKGDTVRLVKWRAD